MNTLYTLRYNCKEGCGMTSFGTRNQMPILNIKQPEYVIVSDDIRLRKFGNNFAFALEWYQDEETIMLVDGDKYVPIGDVTFSCKDMPIVIGVESYRGQGVGNKVVMALVERGKQLGYSCLLVNEIYKYNIGSQKLFGGVGFGKYEETKNGYRYK